MCPHPLRPAHKLSGTDLQLGRPELGDTEADVEISKQKSFKFEVMKPLLFIDNAKRSAL